jgi:uncharacterized protein (DUF58 family)
VGSPLTVRGWGLAASGVALLIAGALVGIKEFYPVGAAALALVAGSWVWLLRNRCDIEVARWVQPQRVPAGGAARVDLYARNASERRSPVLMVRDPLDGGRRVAEVALAPLRRGDEVRTAYRLPALERGIYSVGPALLVAADPFGLTRRVKVAGGAARLVVHPPIEHLSATTLAPGRDSEARAGAVMVSAGGDEFFAVREYRTGDDLRHVHWASTARRDNLMIRQVQVVLEGRLVILVDLREAIHDTATLESVLAAAATLAEAAMRGGHHVRLVTTAGADTGFGAGSDHRGLLLDVLAAARVHAGGDWPGPPAGGAPSVVITTDAAQPSDLALLAGGAAGGADDPRRPQQGGAMTVVVFGRAEPRAQRHPGSGAGTGPVGGRRDLRVVTVPAGAPFGATWARAAASWRTGTARGGP